MNKKANILICSALTLTVFLNTVVKGLPTAAFTGEPSLVARYDFSGNFDDLMGGSTLTEFGPLNDGFNRNNATSEFGADAEGTYWQWSSTLSRGGGFWIDVEDDISESYTVGVRFSFQNTGPGWRKIIDYNNAQSDAGFYFYGGGKLSFYPYVTLGLSTTGSNEVVDIIATRSAEGMFTAYTVVGGILYQELEVEDTHNYAIPSVVGGKPRFGFFFDDNATGSEATSGGKVYSVRIWNGPISAEEAQNAMSSAVTYHGNGNTGGIVPLDINSYQEGEAVAVLGNAGNLSKEGYVFAGWNTAADGSGTGYDAGDTFIMGTVSMTLYAQWAPFTGYTVTYHGNGNSGGEVPADGNRYDEGATVTILDNTGNLIKSGHIFTGWNTRADGSGDNYTAGSTYTMAGENTALFAVWTIYSSGGASDDGLPLSSPEKTGGIIVDGLSQENALTERTESNRDGQKVTVVTLNENRVNTILERLPAVTLIQIPVSGAADVIVGELTGQTVKEMERKAVVLEVKTATAVYTLPAIEINIDDVSRQLGESVRLSDIIVQIQIARPTAAEAAVVKDTIKKAGFEMVVSPVQFSVQCKFGEKTVAVNSFNSFVERSIAIPHGVDPSGITTAVVVEPDGTLRHVPTKVTVIDGIYFAKINSLTNSIYTLIWNTAEFNDLAEHWSREDIHDMASRLVLSGMSKNLFAPAKEVTRAEFTDMMVRALGLKAKELQVSFTDVDNNEWYLDALNSGLAYNLVTGYGDGRFGPADKITREQAMIIIHRALHFTKIAGDFSPGEMQMATALYADYNDAAEYARESVALSLHLGIVNGRNSRIIAPKAALTRAEAAVMIRRMLRMAELI